MPERKEKIYISEEKRIEEALVKIEIPEEEFNTLQIIAKRVGGDFGMEVRLGKPGEGSFFNPEDCSITFDPLHIKEKLEQGKFVAGHEGAHRAITPSPKEIGFSQEKIEELYSQIGFGYLNNAVEDTAANDWMGKRFPGLKEYTERVYDEQFKEKGAVLSTPEIQKIAGQLGYWPKFVQYGSEVIRDWHEKKFSQDLDPAVKKALKRTIEDVRRSRSTIPDPEKREEKEIISTAQERFKINTEYIWPEVKKLVEMDLHTEELRQMMSELRQRQEGLKQKREKLKQAEREGDQQKQEELKKELENLEKELDPFNQLPEKTKKELQEKIDKAVQQSAGQLNKDVEEKQKRIEDAKSRQEELEKEIKDLEEKMQSASGKEKEELEKQLQQKKGEKLEQEMKQRQGEQELKEIQDALENIQSGKGGIPYPEDKLSQETKKELEKLYQKLPSHQKKGLREEAERQLEDLEDTLNKEMQGKLNKDKPESHQEKREREEAEKEKEEEKRRAEEERKELEKKLEKARREKMTEYDKAYEEVSDIINSLYIRLKRFFLPERHPKWQKGYPTGSRLDIEKAMQAEVEPRYLEKLWERKTIPRKLDYRFSILVDLSGSMKGEKIEETFKGLVVLVEVLEKLGLQHEIIGFSSEVRQFKEWREKLDKKKRDELTELKAWGREYTHTDEAAELALKHILENRGKDNFILTLTDGQPYPEEHGARLREILKEIKDKNIKALGVGLGSGTEFVQDYYPASLTLPNVKPTEGQKRQGQKDFSEAFADLLEDMIRHPGKY